MQRTDLVDIQKRMAGLWVAVLDGEVVAAAVNPNDLFLRLKTNDIVGATVFRCPDEHESELVGLG